MCCLFGMMDYGRSQVSKHPTIKKIIYSALSNYIHELFLKWAIKFLQIIEDEVNDDFHLNVVAESFETMFLQDIQNSYSACISYETGSYPIAYSVDERLDILNCSERSSFQFTPLREGRPVRVLA